MVSLLIFFTSVFTCGPLFYLPHIIVGVFGLNHPYCKLIHINFLAIKF